MRSAPLAQKAWRSVNKKITIGEVTVEAWRGKSGRGLGLITLPLLL
jgi:hypothetical protein